MKIKRPLILLSALCLCLCSTACGTKVRNGDNSTESSSQSSTAETTTTAETSAPEQSSSQAETTSSEKPEILEKIIIGNYVTYQEFSETKQAEQCKLSGDAKTAAVREGFSGDGYVTGLSKDDQWQADIELPSDQYYHVSVTVASDEKIKTALCIDGRVLTDFTTSGSGRFEVITVKNNYIEKGTHTLSLKNVSAKLDIDLCGITASKEISDISFKLDSPRLSNADADLGAKTLYSYICSCYGENVILAQHDTVGTNAETELIAKTTGRYPAIRFGDLMMNTDPSSDAAKKELECANEYAKQGGILAYMWHWNAPVGKRGYYTEDTDFDLSKAVTKENIAELPIEQIQKLADEKKISAECLALVKDIDTVSQVLGEFKKADIPVIWRPLHEASNGYFWWGKNAESYKWLWDLLYTRQTKYHKLSNLIWVWSAQNAGWYVGDAKCDIISVDIYDKGSSSGNVNSLLFLQKTSKKKPCAITECGNFPSIQSIADQKAMWSFIAQWGGNFLMKEDGSLSEEYNTKDSLQEMYNNNRTVTKDKLPDFSKLREQVKKQEEERAKAETTTSAAPAETTAQSSAQSSQPAQTTAPNA